MESKDGCDMDWRFLGKSRNKGLSEGELEEFNNVLVFIKMDKGFI